MLFSDLATLSYGSLTSDKQWLESLLALEQAKVAKLSTDHDQLVQDIEKWKSQATTTMWELKQVQLQLEG